MRGDWGGERTALARAGIVFTMPAIRNFGENPVSEIVGTFVLVRGVAGKKGNSGWSYAAVPVVGPRIGAGLAGWFVRLSHF